MAEPAPRFDASLTFAPIPGGALRAAAACPALAVSMTSLALDNDQPAGMSSDAAPALPT